MKICQSSKHDKEKKKMWQFFSPQIIVLVLIFNQL